MRFGHWMLLGIIALFLHDIHLRGTLHPTCGVRIVCHVGIPLSLSLSLTELGQSQQLRDFIGTANCKVCAKF